MRDKEIVMEVLRQIEEAAAKIVALFRLFTRWPTLPNARQGLIM